MDWFFWLSIGLYVVPIFVVPICVILENKTKNETSTLGDLLELLPFMLIPFLNLPVMFICLSQLLKLKKDLIFLDFRKYEDRYLP